MLLATARKLASVGEGKVYVLLCEHNTYYVGFSRNVERRIRQHFDGIGACFTKLHKPIRVVEIINGLGEKEEFEHWTLYAKKYGASNVGGYTPWLCAELGFVYPFPSRIYDLAVRSIKRRKVNNFRSFCEPRSNQQKSSR